MHGRRQVAWKRQQARRYCEEEINGLLKNVQSSGDAGRTRPVSLPESKAGSSRRVKVAVYGGYYLFRQNAGGS